MFLFHSRFLKKYRGFTSAELMIALTLSSVFLLGTGSLLFTLHKLSSRVYSKSTLISKLRFFESQLQADIEQAATIELDIDENKPIQYPLYSRTIKINDNISYSLLPWATPYGESGTEFIRQQGTESRTLLKNVAGTFINKQPFATDGTAIYVSLSCPTQNAKPKGNRPIWLRFLIQK